MPFLQKPCVAKSGAQWAATPLTPKTPPDLRTLETQGHPGGPSLFSPATPTARKGPSSPRLRVSAPYSSDSFPSSPCGSSWASSSLLRCGPRAGNPETPSGALSSSSRLLRIGFASGPAALGLGNPLPAPALTASGSRAHRFRPFPRPGARSVPARPPSRSRAAPALARCCSETSSAEPRGTRVLGLAPALYARKKSGKCLWRRQVLTGGRTSFSRSHSLAVRRGASGRRKAPGAASGVVSRGRQRPTRKQLARI